VRLWAAGRSASAGRACGFCKIPQGEETGLALPSLFTPSGGYRFGRRRTDFDARRRRSAVTSVRPRVLAVATKKRSAASPCGKLKRPVSSTISAVSGASFRQKRSTQRPQSNLRVERLEVLKAERVAHSVSAIRQLRDWLCGSTLEGKAADLSVSRRTGLRYLAAGARGRGDAFSLDKLSTLE
jgi:hypothetical protein